MVPRALNREGAHSQARGDRVCEIHLKADQVVWIFRVLKDVGRAALRIGAPTQLTARANACKRIIGARHRREND